MRLAYDLLYSIFEYCCSILIIVCSIRKVEKAFSVQYTLRDAELALLLYETASGYNGMARRTFWEDDRPPVPCFKVDGWVRRIRL